MNMTLTQAVSQSSVLSRPLATPYEIPLPSQQMHTRDDGEEEPVDDTIIVD